MSISYTFLQIILPVLIPIFFGALLHYKFKFDLISFSKLNLYYYVPALAFIKIYESKVSSQLVFSVFGFLLLQFSIMAIAGYVVCRLMKSPPPLAASFANSILLVNNGNIGIPVNAFAFKHDPFAMSIQIMVVVFEMVMTFTVGLLNASKTAMGIKKSLVLLAKMPIIYTIALGAMLNYFHIGIAEPLRLSLTNIADGMVSFALVTIGAQIASANLQRNTVTILVSSLLRLVLSPLSAYVLIQLLQLHGITAQALFIASAMPTSRNSAALALEYNNEPVFAAQAVLVSTLLSSITLTIVIGLAQYIS